MLSEAHWITLHLLLGNRARLWQWLNCCVPNQADVTTLFRVRMDCGNSSHRTVHTPASQADMVLSKSNTSRGVCASSTTSSMTTCRSAAAGLDGWGTGALLAAGMTWAAGFCCCCCHKLSGYPCRRNLKMMKAAEALGWCKGLEVMAVLLASCGWWAHTCNGKRGLLQPLFIFQKQN